MRELTKGTVVDGRYTIVQRLGSGGMADVYCADDAQLGRRVALKVLYARFAEDDEFVERFRREASSAAGLQHQHVVSVYDRGEWEGTSYIAMEFVDGRTLKEIVRAEAPMEPLRAIEIVVQVLKAARFAHRRGVIHRDLKPHNVLVEENSGPPHAKVADFGIARAGASDMTQTGSIMGTAQYLSPEQAQGHAVTPQSDIYSIGICLYEMLTGSVPFDGESAVTIALKQVNEAPVPPSHYNRDVPAPLEDAVLRALAKDPAERFADADAFIAALEDARAQIQAGSAPPAQPTAAFTALAPIPPAAAVAPVAYEEEVVVSEERPPRDGMSWGWTLLIALLVVGGILAALFLTGTIGAEKVRVPNVIGISDTAAKKKLNSVGLEIDIEQVVDDQPAGTVISQNPTFGTRVKKGTVVSVSVSSGPGEEQVPDVEGMKRLDARKTISDAGFEVAERRESSSDVEKGRVIRTTPPVGSELQLGRTVTLIVSGGPPDVAAPPVVGRTLDEARSDLNAAGFEVDTVDQETTDAEPGTVLAQDPAAGTQVEEGSKVTLTVAQAPKKAEVPDVVGQTDSDAFRILQEAGFDVTLERQDVETPDEDGIVVDQDPKGGKDGDLGTPVTIVVGRFNPDLNPEGTDVPPEQPPAPEARR